jgi:hypothetical protein
LLTASPSTEFFAQNPPHLSGSKRLVCFCHVSRKRVVNEGLVSLAGALGEATEVVNDRVIQVDRDARLTAIGGYRAAASGRKVNGSLHSPYALSVRASELKLAARYHCVSSKPPHIKMPNAFLPMLTHRCSPSLESS